MDTLTKHSLTLCSRKHQCCAPICVNTRAGEARLQSSPTEERLKINACASHSPLPQDNRSNRNRNSINCTKPWLIGQQTAISSSLSSTEKGEREREKTKERTHCSPFFKEYMISFWETIYLGKNCTTEAQQYRGGGYGHWRYWFWLTVEIWKCYCPNILQRKNTPRPWWAEERNKGK